MRFLLRHVCYKKVPAFVDTMPVVMAVNSLDIATTQREYNTCWYLYLVLIWWTEKLLLPLQK